MSFKAVSSKFSRRTRIKICGICSVEDAQLAVTAGADAIGLVFYPQSPRNVSLDQAKEISRSLPAFVNSVALFVDPNEAEVRKVIDYVGVDLLQFHGYESAEFATQFSKPYLKAIRVGDGSSQSLKEICDQHSQASGFLFDTFDRNQAGGTGKTFDWSQFDSRQKGAVLAGGLDPTNVGDAIRTTNAYAVDVSSGVEQCPGEKSAEKIDAFVRACRLADDSVLDILVNERK